MENNYIRLLEIIGIVGKIRNCGINDNLLICEFLRICWNIFGDFIVKNNYIRLLEIIGIIGKIRNCGKNYNLLIREFLRICWNIFGNFFGEK